MKFLITSGGTKVPIDDVRHIGNMSKGTFGTEIARAALRLGHTVSFLHAQGSKAPHIFTGDLSPYGFRKSLHEMAVTAALMDEVRDRYQHRAYTTYHDYAKDLAEELVDFKPDVVILAAAVSDYAPEPEKGKISTKETVTIVLRELPKVINEVKIIAPEVYLVGFKLLVNSTKQELLEAMQKQSSRTGADLVVGNDLRDIRANEHQLALLYKDGRFGAYGGKPGKDLADLLVFAIINDFHERSL